MREQKLYVCDYCGTQYKDKKTCQECEKKHVAPAEILSCRYISLKINKKGYPEKIEIKMTDGSVQTYKRLGGW